MDHASTDFQQLTGNLLQNDLILSFGVFHQEKMYQNSIEKLQREQKELQAQKSIWKFQKVLKNPPKWMIVTIIILGFIVGYLTFGALWGSRKRWSYSNLEPLLAGMLAIAFFQAVSERNAIIVFLKKAVKELSSRIPDKNQTLSANQAAPIIVAVLIIFVAIRLDSNFFSMLLWWLIYAICFIGTYRFMGWLECKSIHPELWKTKTEAYFAPKEEELAKESSNKQKQLETLRTSDLMSFAHAIVPSDFWDSGKLAALINLMDNKSINTLAEGIAAYKKRPQNISAEQQNMLEGLYWKIALQNEKFQQLLCTLE